MNEITAIRKPVSIPGVRAKLIRGGKAYFDLLIGMIANANESIHIQTYIYDDDETGKRVSAALKEAAGRNVAVYLMADGYASQVMSQDFINSLRHSGVHFRFFDPILKSRYFYFGRRLHHKIVVTDGKYCLVGGVNVSDRYNDMPGKPAWLDFALYAEGDIGLELKTLCLKTWNGYKPIRGLVADEKANTKDRDNVVVPLIEMRRNDWVRKKKEVNDTYLEMFDKAQSHILIICSYFLPGKTIRYHLRKASGRGVKIKIITAGRSDVPLAKSAERWLYDWLLRNKIELYEYQPTVLHAKLAICDGQWLTVGSYNINDLSAYASIELNLNVHDQHVAHQAENVFYDIMRDSIPVTVRSHTRSYNVFRQFGRWLSFRFIRIVFNILTFYYKQKG